MVGGDGCGLVVSVKEAGRCSAAHLDEEIGITHVCAFRQ